MNNSHAWLLHGGTAPEREALAFKIAAEAVCRGDNPPCGKCESCLKAERGLHPDIIRIERAQDKASLYVAQIRALAEDAVISPNEALHKVYIIPEAEKLLPQAQNAFLKLLEEPPKGVIFILCASTIGSLLQTVLSRCTRIRIKGGESVPVSPLLDAVNSGSDSDKVEAAFSLEKLDRASVSEALASLWCGLADAARNESDYLRRKELTYLADFTAELIDKSPFLSAGSIAGLLALGLTKKNEVNT